MQKHISKEYLEEKRIASLRAQFSRNKPFHHLILKDFFEEKFIQTVAHELKKEEFAYQDADLYSFSQTADFSRLSSPILQEFYRLLNSPAFKRYLLQITGIQASGTIDCSGFLYTSKDILLPHDDYSDKRRITYNLSLSKDFTHSDGGALDFFDHKKIAVSLRPQFNTFVLFKVMEGKTIHQISEVLSEKQRWSVSGWFNDQ